MPSYLLDTNIVSAVMGEHPKVKAALALESESSRRAEYETGKSAEITYAEPHNRI
jgi:hypothetical protein